MNIVVDAQIVGAYYRESVLGESPRYAAGSETLFDGLGEIDVAYIDAGGNIEYEWGRMADPDWFREWLGDVLASGAVSIIEVPRRREIEKHLRTHCGFPRSRDIWYVFTAVEVVSAGGVEAGLVTEDCDFFEPAAKADAKRRAKHLASGKGCVADYLRKSHQVHARCLAVHCTA